MPSLKTPRPAKRSSGEAYAPTVETSSAVEDNPSPWAPLATPIYRLFWIASIVSNLGTWIHEIGAGWLMTSLDASPEMVAAVRVAMALPMTVLAIPAGVLADRIDRRRLLILTQLAMLSTTSVLATLTFTEVITSWWLLALTFTMGLGMVLHILTWQSTIPELVPRVQLPRAIALGSISFNLARAGGPALGGVLIAMAGPWVAFAANAVSFAFVLVVLFSWKRENTESSRGLSYRASLVEGIRYVAGETAMRWTLARLMLFMLPASTLWALLPLVAKERLGWEADGFGLLVTMVGAGAVAAAWALHRMHHRFGMNRTVWMSMLCFAVALGWLSTATTGPPAMMALFVMGASWMTTLTTLNSTAQMTLPNELRARGMSCYLMTMAISMAGGSLLWGQVAGEISVESAQKIAAATMVVSAATVAFVSVGRSETAS